MVRHAPIHRRSGHSDIAICCGRNVRGSSPSTSVVPLSNQVTTLNHKRFKGFKMFSDGHLKLPTAVDRITMSNDSAQGRAVGAHPGSFSGGENCRWTSWAQTDSDPLCARSGAVDSQHRRAMAHAAAELP